uniref:Uncharacterized protein n=1 Tax=Aegilops tauschii TaxID=37682 RepID=M8CIK3_AEGTA
MVGGVSDRSTDPTPTFYLRALYILANLSKNTYKLLVGFDTLTYRKRLQLIPYTCGLSPLDPALALTCVDNPARLGAVDSPIVRLVSDEYDVSGDKAPFVCLGGFRNTRGGYELEEGEGQGLMLELDETPFDFGTNYELECETAEPEQAKEVLERLLTVAGGPYEYSRSNKFACFMAGKLLP